MDSVASLPKLATLVDFSGVADAGADEARRLTALIDDVRKVDGTHALLPELCELRRAHCPHVLPHLILARGLYQQAGIDLDRLGWGEGLAGLGERAAHTEPPYILLRRGAPRVEERVIGHMDLHVHLDRSSGRG